MTNTNSLTKRQTAITRQMRAVRPTTEPVVVLTMDDIEDAEPMIAVPRTISADVRSRRSFIERARFESFDEEITKVEAVTETIAAIRGAA